MVKHGVDGWSNTPVIRRELGGLVLEIGELPSKLARQGVGRYLSLIGNRTANTPQSVAKMLLASMHSEHVEWFVAIFESQTRVVKPMITDRMTSEIASKFQVDEVWPGSSNLKNQIEWILGCLDQNFTDFLVEAFGGKKEGTAERGESPTTNP